MSKVRLTGSNSGYVEIAAVADAGNLSFTMPTHGTSLLGNGNNVYTGITTFNGVTFFNDDVTFDGATAGYDVVWDRSDNALEFAANTKATFGNSQDMQLFHDGNHGYINDAGTGNLRLRSGTLEIQNLAGSKTSAVFSSGGGQTLNFNNSSKFVTTNTGVVVTGICTATSFSGDGSNLTGLSTPLSFRNLIINGAMEVAQRGTSSTSSGMNSVDRFTSNWSGGGVTQAQISEQSGTVFENGFNNYLRLTNTSNTTTDTDYRFIGQTIEARNVANSGWNFKSPSSYVTLSAWVRSSLAGTYYGWLNSRDGSGHTYTFSYTLSANTWTKITKTIPGNSNVLIHNNNEEGLVVHFIPWYGTYYTTSGHTLNTWITQDSTNRCPDFGQNWANTSNATFDVTGVQLEVGSTATPFEQRSFADELIRCKRYFNRHGYDTQHGVAKVRIIPGINEHPSNYGLYVNFNFDVEMRATPTITFGSNVSVGRPQVGVQQRITYTSTSSDSPSGIGFMRWASSGSHGGQLGSTGDAYYYVKIGNDSNSYIDCSAEI